MFGKLYCDPCIDAMDRQREDRHRGELRTWHVREAEARGLIRPMTVRTQFAEAHRPSAENAAAWEAAVNWGKQGRRMNVYIYGPPGVGKSHLARCMLNAAFVDGCSVGEITGHMVSTLSAYKPEAIERWAWPDVLLIDDADKGAWGPLGVSILWELLDRREQRSLRTILTANAAPNAWRDYLLRKGGENEALVPAALDRLRTRHGRALVLQLTGESLRGAAFLEGDTA